jgi:spore germination protein KB
LNSAFKGVALTTFLGLIMMIEIIALFGSSLSTQFKIPMLSLVRYIEVFDFIERIDALVVVMWIGAGFVKITIFYYCLTITTAEFFDLKSYKPVVLPLGIILVVFSMILFGSSEEVVMVIANILPPYYLFLKIGIPLMLLLIVIIRKVTKKSG